MSRFTTNRKILDSITTAITSGAVDTSLRKKYGVELVGDTTSPATVNGTVVFSFLVSNDGTNFVTYNRLTSNLTDSNAENDTRVASVTLTTSTTSAFVFFPQDDYFRYIKAAMAITSGAILTSSISAAGSGYSINDVLTVADGTSGTITVLTVDGLGAVLTYSVTTAGTGYTVATHATSYGGAGTGFILSVDSVNPGSFTATLQDID